MTHTTAFVTPVVEHWLEREIAQWVHPMKDRSDDPSHHERTLLRRSYISLPSLQDCEGTVTYRGSWQNVNSPFDVAHRHTAADKRLGRLNPHLAEQVDDAYNGMNACLTTPQHEKQVVCQMPIIESDYAL